MRNLRSSWHRKDTLKRTNVESVEYEIIIKQETDVEDAISKLQEDKIGVTMKVKRKSKDPKNYTDKKPKSLQKKGAEEKLDQNKSNSDQEKVKLSVKQSLYVEALEDFNVEPTDDFGSIHSFVDEILQDLSETAEPDEKSKISNSEKLNSEADSKNVNHGSAGECCESHPAGSTGESCDSDLTNTVSQDDTIFAGKNNLSDKVDKIKKRKSTDDKADSDGTDCKKTKDNDNSVQSDSTKTAKPGNLSTTKQLIYKKPFKWFEKAIKNKTGNASSDINHGNHDKKSVKCEAEDCKKIFSSRVYMMEHFKKIHAKAFKCKCDHCGKQFISMCYLKRHESIHIEHTKFRCWICKKRFNQLPYLKAHIIKVHKIKDKTVLGKQLIRFKNKKINAKKTKPSEYRCEVDGCQKVFVSKQKRTDHFIRKHREKRSKCEICGKAFAFESGLLKHTAFHYDIKPFGCWLCKSSYKVDTSLRRHLNERHNVTTDNMPLEQLKGIMKTFENIKYNVEDLNPPQFLVEYKQKSGSFVCHICGKTLQQRSLKEHMAIHTGEKNCICEVCGKGFYKKGKQYIDHMRLHTGEKPFTCNLCNRSFRLAQSLKLHLSVHSGIKPYECDVCERSFSRRSHLINHANSQHGGHGIKKEKRIGQVQQNLSMENIE